MSATATQIPYLGKAALRALGNDELLERIETLTETCIALDSESSRMGWLRSQLDPANREGERRKLISWR